MLEFSVIQESKFGHSGAEHGVQELRNTASMPILLVFGYNKNNGAETRVTN